ncbi:hypothetical protein DRQ53_02205 [bacterium]|nr:MAG: hypothetical protein DRQ32_09960 [bacterium]RKZ17892.1 MAG: hypothetical protein DRQ53_02205 [bacterium]
MARRPNLTLISADDCAPTTVARLEQLLPGLAACVDHLILRWKDGSARTQLAAARQLAAVDPRPALLLRDRFDIARAADLEGVQLPEDSMQASLLRSFWPEAVLGVSRHDTAGLQQRSSGADFALLSPIFPSPSKPGEAGLGLAAMVEMIRQSPLPVLAMGGVDEPNCASLIEAGASGIAVRSAILEAGDPVAAANRIRSLIDSAAATLPDH